MPDSYERFAVLAVSVLLILSSLVLHALRLSDTFTDDLTLIAVGALYMGVVPSLRPVKPPLDAQIR